MPSPAPRKTNNHAGLMGGLRAAHSFPKPPMRPMRFQGVHTRRAMLAVFLAAACAGEPDTAQDAAPTTTADSAAIAAAPTTDAPAAASDGVGDPSRAPNEMGRIMVLEYHLIGDKEARWER